MVETNVPKIIDSYKKDNNYPSPSPSVPTHETVKRSIHDLHTDSSDDDNLTPPLPLVIQNKSKSSSSILTFLEIGIVLALAIFIFVEYYKKRIKKNN
jgi:hypothetical protein